MPTNSKEYAQNYYAKNREKHLQYNKKYYEQNKEKHSAYSKDYYQKNKEHIKKRTRKWREENKEKYSEWYKSWYADPRNRDKLFYSNLKTRARKSGIHFDLEVSDVSDYDVCPVFGWALERNISGKTYAPNSPSVDRIIPSLGYTKGNIQIISQKANMMKQDATPEELLMFADWIYKTYGHNAPSNS